MGLKVLELFSGEKSSQLDLFSKLWETGHNECYKGGHCRLRPCNVAQQVLCCGECEFSKGCDSKCPKT